MFKNHWLVRRKFIKSNFAPSPSFSTLLCAILLQHKPDLFVKYLLKKLAPSNRNWLTPRSWVLLEKPPVAQLSKNIPTLYKTRRFINVFTRVSHWSLSWARWIQSIPRQSICLRLILLLSFHMLVHLGLHSALFPYGSLTKILHAFLFSNMRAPYPSHLILLGLIAYYTLPVINLQAYSSSKNLFIYIYIIVVNLYNCSCDYLYSFCVVCPLLCA
jgi:hypothetical protein